MNDSSNKPVPYGVTKAEVRRQREYYSAPQARTSMGLFSGVRKLFS
ncbi:hypothetical protein [Kordiimonas aquimaris]|nr:hypothetical protein [Kordiimonas aquimaris]